MYSETQGISLACSNTNSWLEYTIVRRFYVVLVPIMSVRFFHFLMNQNEREKSAVEERTRSKSNETNVEGQLDYRCGCSMQPARQSLGCKWRKSAVSFIRLFLSAYYCVETRRLIRCCFSSAFYCQHICTLGLFFASFCLLVFFLTFSVYKSPWWIIHCETDSFRQLLLSILHAKLGIFHSALSPTLNAIVSRLLLAALAIMNRLLSHFTRSCPFRVFTLNSLSRIRERHLADLEELEILGCTSWDVRRI